MKKGYSLGEAMVALAIVGFIAMLTIPILVRKTQDMANISKLQKTYKVLYDAVGIWMVDDRISNITQTSFISQHPDLFISKYLKSFNQSSTSTQNLLSDCYSDKDSDKFHMNFVDSFSCASLPNGSTVCLTPYNASDYIVLRNCGVTTYKVQKTRQVEKTRKTGNMCTQYVDYDPSEKVCTLSESLYVQIFEALIKNGDFRWVNSNIHQLPRSLDDPEFCSYVASFDDSFFVKAFADLKSGSQAGRILERIGELSEMSNLWYTEREKILEAGGILAFSGDGKVDKCNMTGWKLKVMQQEPFIEYLSFQNEAYKRSEGIPPDVIVQIKNKGNDYYKELKKETDLCCKVYTSYFGKSQECPAKSGFSTAPCLETYYETETYEEDVVDNEVSSQSRVSTLDQNKVHSQSSDVPVVEVVVDTNGASLPNKLGTDLFMFYIYPDGYIGVKSQDTSNDKCLMNQYYQCFKSVFNNDWKKPY